MNIVKNVATNIARNVATANAMDDVISNFCSNFFRKKFCSNFFKNVATIFRANQTIVNVGLNFYHAATKVVEPLG